MRFHRYLLKTEANPNGLPIEAIDQIRAGVQADRNQFMTGFPHPFLWLQSARRKSLSRLAR